MPRLKEGFVDLLVIGYVRQKLGILSPKIIDHLIVKFFGILYNVSYKSNILNSIDDKLNYTEMISKQLGYCVDLKRIYSAKSNGFKANSFRLFCYHRGATVTLIRNTNNYLFGGYTSISWKTEDTYVPDSNAFLYNYYPNNKICPLKSNNDKYAVRHYKNSQIALLLFGGDLMIRDSCNKTSMNYCRPSRYMFDHGTELVGGDITDSNIQLAYFMVSDIEVFHVKKS